MDTRKIEKFLRDFGLHIALVVAGLILLANPDGATALVTKIIGWALVIGCAARLISLATGNQLHWVRDAFFTGAALCVGVILLARPMIMADSLGRFFGILLLIEGFRNLRYSGVRLLTALTITAGIVLILVPRTLTQTLLTVCGLVMIITGVINILVRRSINRRLKADYDPNIIDADQ